MFNVSIYMYIYMYIYVYIYICIYNRDTYINKTGIYPLQESIFIIAIWCNLPEPFEFFSRDPVDKNSAGHRACQERSVRRRW